MSLRTRRACEDTVISCEKEGEVIDRHKLTLISCQTARKGALGGGWSNGRRRPERADVSACVRRHAGCGRVRASSVSIRAREVIGLSSLLQSMGMAMWAEKLGYSEESVLSGLYVFQTFFFSMRKSIVHTSW